MLKIDQLSKHFIMHIRNDAKIEGFDGNLLLAAQAGELVAITGPSGSGKSSLLKCIYRTYTPTGGHVYYTDSQGQTVNLAKVEPWEIIRGLAANEIGYVSQFFSVIPRVSALDILTSTQTARRRSPGGSPGAGGGISGKGGDLPLTVGYVPRHIQRRRETAARTLPMR